MQDRALIAGALIASLALVLPAAAANAPQRELRKRDEPVQLPLVSDERIAAARDYARSRGPGVSFAVIDEPGGAPRGLHRNATYPSASVSKAMLMVAVLRSARSRPLTARERRLIKPMVTASDNDAASAVYAIVGGAGLRSVARAARMRRFEDVGFWAGARLTPADQARLFYRIDRLVPLRHRAFARAMLASVVSYQRWGIARVAQRRGYRIFFKGGWRTNINHQSALLVKNGRRVAISVMTDQDGVAGQRTEEGIASRLLR